MSMGGEENRDPTVDAALEVLKRPRIQTQLPALRGSGVAAAGTTPYEDYLRTWGNVAPEVTTASAVAPAPPADGGPDGYSDSSTNPAWDAMSMSEKAAYYADNPTAGKIGRVVGDYFSNTPYGMMQNYFDPGIQTQTDAIMAGMDPTGWQFAGRNNDGIFGTQIGGTLSFPELSPENYGSHGEVGAVYGPTVAQSTTPSVGSYATPMVNSYTTVDLSSGPVADASGESYGGIVTDSSGRAVTTSDGSAVSYGDGGVNAGDGGRGSGNINYDAGDMAHGGGSAPAPAPADQAEADAAAADAAAGPCCFIMLEARYGDGTMDDVVRKYRDEMMTDKNRRGYYKLAEVLVPLMRRSRVFKFIVQKTFADPLVSYGKWHYKENKHGWVFAPIKSMWMKVFDVLGGDTEFIRENGQVV